MARESSLGLSRLMIRLCQLSTVMQFIVQAEGSLPQTEGMKTFQMKMSEGMAIQAAIHCSFENHNQYEMWW